MNLRNLTRTGTAFVAGATLVAAVSAGAYALPTSFNVSTTINNSCVITDSGPADLTPTYSPISDSGTGSATVLSTFCNGSSPFVLFYDGWDSGATQFAMSNGTTNLFFQLSNSSTCSGVPGDNPMPDDGTPSALPSGSGSFDICAAVTTGGLNVSAPAGSYTDTVTYEIFP